PDLSPGALLADDRDHQPAARRGGGPDGRADGGADADQGDGAAGPLRRPAQSARRPLVIGRNATGPEICRNPRVTLYLKPCCKDERGRGWRRRCRRWWCRMPAWPRWSG